MRRGFAIVALLVATVWSFSAAADCIPVSTPADLDNMRGNLAGAYCLTNDIDMSAVSDWSPIDQFTGQLFGNDHAIQNLTSTQGGLFAAINSATVQDLNLTSANINGGGGILATSSTNGTTISNLSVSGQITATNFYVGGVVGHFLGTMTGVSSSASVNGIGERTYYAGGLIAMVERGPGGGTASVEQSYFTGAVNCNQVCAAGGIVGYNYGGDVDLSYSSQSVSISVGGDNDCAGGLIGWMMVADANGGNYLGSLTRSYSEGRVSSAAGEVGGLIGCLTNSADDSSNAVTSNYAVGPVGVATGETGGLVGKCFFCALDTVSDSYWDTKTTGSPTSTWGTPMSTEELQSALPAGFDPSVWGITAGESYPYLLNSQLRSPLATQLQENANTAGSERHQKLISRDGHVATAPSTLLYVFLPISQLDSSEYDHARSMKQAALATVYTMIARSVGTTRNITDLEGVKVDTYFWNGKKQTTTWQGPVTQYASLSDLISMPLSEPFDDSNVIGAMKQRSLVILRATSGETTHWLLGTLYTTKFKKLYRVIAHDPWTGRQVEIDPSTKKIVGPKPLPGWLKHLVVDAYQVVTLN